MITEWKGSADGVVYTVNRAYQLTV